MITKAGAAVAASIKPVSSMGAAKPLQIKAVDPMEKKPIMPTTQTQDVANNLRGVHEDGYDSREGFGRPDISQPNDTKKIAMITKTGNDLLEKDAGVLSAAWTGLTNGAKGLLSLGKGTVQGARGGVAMPALQLGRNATGTFDVAKAGYTGAKGGFGDAWANLGKIKGAQPATAAVGLGGTGVAAYGMGSSITPMYPQQFSGSWQ